MKKVCELVGSKLGPMLLAVTVSGYTAANVHQDAAPLGDAVADRIVEQPQIQTDLLLLVRDFKNEQQQLVELVTQLSSKAQEDASFFSKWLTDSAINADIKDKIQVLEQYKQRFTITEVLSTAHKAALITAINALIERLQNVINTDSSGKALALQSLSDVLQQLQQQDVNRKEMALPATPYTLTEEELDLDSLPAVGSAPYYVNPQSLPSSPSRRKRDLRAIQSLDGVPERPGRAACYAAGQVDAQDLSTTPEVPINEDIVALARSLDHSPLKIFNYVANQFDYELYQGSVKGALGVLSSKAGNDTDHASLLIALLRASGYPARYVRGSIEFDRTRTEHLEWVKINDLQAAMYTLARTGKKIAVEKSNEGDYTIQVDHVWVETCIPYANYRGTQQDDSGYQWLSLDASYKRHSLHSGIQHGVTFDYETFFKQRSESLAHELYEEQIERAIKAVQPNATIKDVGDRWTRQQRQYTHIPESLPYRVANYLQWSNSHTASSIATLPSTHRKQLFIEINGTQKTRLNLLDSTQKRVTLSFKGESSWHQRRYQRWQQGLETLTCPKYLKLKPVIKLDGVEVPSRNPLSVNLCDGNNFKNLKVKISVGFSEGAQENRSVTFDGISPLNYHALQAYGFQSSDQYLQQRTARLLTAINSHTHPWQDPDSVVGEYLDVVLLKYMRYINDGMSYLGNLDSKTTLGGHHIGLTSTQAKVEYLFDMPLAINATNLLVDVPGGKFIHGRDPSSQGIDETFKLAGVLTSQYESYIWQENADRDAVSTISGLQIAHQQNVPVKTFTESNALKAWLTRCRSWEQPKRCYPGAVIDSLALRLKNEGGELTIPQRPLDYEGWNGLISMHITENFGSFSINRYNGGYALDKRVETVERQEEVAQNYLPSVEVQREIEELERRRAMEAEYQREQARLARLREQDWQRERQAQLELQRSQQAYDQQQAEAQRQRQAQQAAESERRRQAQQARQQAQQSKRQEEKQRLLDLAWQQSYQSRQSTRRSYASSRSSSSRSTSNTQTEIAQHTVNSMKTKGVSPEQNDGGDPVNLMTGNMYHIETDFRYPARGLPQMFTRTYNSLGLADGPLGYGWTHNFHHRLKFVDGDNADNKTSNIIWVDGTGAERTIRLFSYGITTRGVGTLLDKNIMTPPGLYFKLKQTTSGYEIHEKNGLVYRFGKVAGRVGDIARLETISDPSGNTLSLAYSGNRMVSVTDPDQRAIRFSYNRAGQITQISDWAGNQFQYEYDASRNLIAVKTPNNTNEPASTYSYYSTSDGTTLNHRMKTFQYANGYQMTFEYYPNGKVFRHTNANNDSMIFKYNNFRRETQTINERGDIERFFFNKKGALVKKIDLNGGKHLHTYEHSLDPFLRTSYTNPAGHRVQYEYDVSGDVIKTTLASGATITYAGYNRFGLPAVTTNAQGDVSLMLYNTEGQLQEQVQFKSGQALPFDYETATAATIAAYADTIVSWQRFHYNAQGNLIKKQNVKDFADPDSGPYVEYGYQDSKNNVSGISPTLVTYRGDLDGDGNIAEQEGYGPYTYEYDELGRILKGYDADRYSFTRQYSSGGRLVSNEDHRGIKTSYQYDPSGLVMSTHHSSFVGGDYQSLGSITFSYDSMNRLVVRGDQSGAVIRYQYDPMGNLTKVIDADGYTSQHEYDPAHQLTTLTTADGRKIHYQYDSVGRKLKVIEPGGNTQSYQYYGPEHNGWLKEVTGFDGSTQHFRYNANGLVIELTDQLDRSTLTDYDALGRVIRTVAPVYEDTVLGQVRPVTTYHYNSLGLLTEIQAGHTNAAGDISADQLAVQATYTYDDFGRKLTETNALNHTWSWTYNEHNQIISLSKPEGQVIHNDYDASGFLSEQSAQHAGQPTLKQRYNYNLLGLVTESENDTAHFRYRYDTAFRLAAVEDLKTGKTLSYDYSLGGLLNRVIDSEGLEIYYQYDPVGRLIGLQTGLKHISFRYDSAGRLASKELPNNTVTKYDYYSGNRLKSIEVVGSHSSIPLEQHNYQYDSAFRVSRYVSAWGTQLKEQRYQYDALDRLTKVFDRERTYDQIDYDPYGNRRERTQLLKHLSAEATGADSVTYLSKTHLFQHNALHQLTRIHEADSNGDQGELVGEFDYNPNGEMIKRKDNASDLSLSYNAFGQLIRAHNPSFQINPGAPPQTFTETYRYGPHGNRLQKTSNGQTLYYRYDRGDLWAEYQDPTASASAYYIQDTEIDQPLVRIDREKGSQFYHSNNLGSITTVTNQNGSVIAKQSYNAWGEFDQYDAANSIPTYGYAGREPDATGLIYYRSRYYDPRIGRFTQQDALGFVDGVNRYAYVMNNPINYIDPWGTMATGPSRSGGFLDQVTNATRNIVMGNAGFWDQYTGGATTAARNAIYGNRDYGADSGYQAGGVGAQVVELIEMATPLGIAKKGVKVAVKESVRGVSKGADSKYSRSGAFKNAKQKAGVPRSQHPDKIYREKIRDQDGYVEGRVYEFKGQNGSTITIREHSLGHKQGNHGPHFNSEVRSANGIKQHLGGNADSHTYFN
jgi:RHS repeat-associated protein